MGLSLEKLFEDARRGGDAALACADVARILHAFVTLPTPALSASVADGSLAASLAELCDALPLAADVDRAALDATIRAINAIDVELGACRIEPTPGGAERPTDLDALRLDFTRLFAHPKHAMAEPCESAFLADARGEERPLVAVNRTASALDALYLRCGMCTNRRTTIPADHIAVELAFFAALADRLAAADSCERALLERELAAFFDEHGFTWWPDFFAQAARHAETPVYHAVCSFAAALFARPS